MSKSVSAEAVSGEVVFIPLGKLKKSPRNARTTPHPEANIAALAASIAAKGLLQNLVVEPEYTDRGKATGHYLVTIGEGRRLAHRLLAKEKRIAKDAPVRCVIDTEHNPREISLAENVLRTPMHPADQYEAFAALQRDQGANAEDIAARFGVTPAVVRQRLKLAAVSPALIALYRDGVLALDQLTAFAITDDHAAQERVWNNLPLWDRQRESILRALTESQVSTADRRAVFVGIDAYEAAGGTLTHDLFDEEGGGYLTDPDLLTRLAAAKLDDIAVTVRAEGWKWVRVEPDYDYANNARMRRIYPVPVQLSADQQTALDALEAEYNALGDAEDEVTEADAAEFERLERDIESLRSMEIFEPEALAQAGAIVSIGFDGDPRIERGFVEKDDSATAHRANGGLTTDSEDATSSSKTPVSEKLVAELTAHRTAALRTEIAQRPDLAFIVLVHALAAETFYPYAESMSCLKLSVRDVPLATHAPGIGESKAERESRACHEEWARRIPKHAEDLWAFVRALADAERLDLMAHCTALAIDAVRAPGTRPTQDALAHADQLARAVALDMTAYWQPTAATYLGRVSKERILEAVREGVSREAADNIAAMKKQAMAETAEQRLAGRGWLPEQLRPAAAAAAE